MAFRTHVGRPMDLRLGSNRLIIGFTVVAAIAALAVMVTGGITDVWVAPVHTFLIWALVREVDPDHDWAALGAAFFAALWVIVGQEVPSAMAVLALVAAARLVLNSTGRRPLTSDLIGLAMLGSAAAYSAEGWVAGFGLALAIYIDDRLAAVPRVRSVIAASVTALGASAVATLTNAIPKPFPEIRPLLALVLGGLALLAIIREPPEPLSATDSRRRTLDLGSEEIVAEISVRLEKGRLHASRTLVGVILFLAALLAGEEAIGLVPAAVGYALALGAGERDRLARRAG
ncbi:MAG: hypothetical protein KY394_03980 [Actinobacteria bacterium]|nr:hypothetical protein [Actinomycetota bacterium]